MFNPLSKTIPDTLKIRIKRLFSCPRSTDTSDIHPVSGVYGADRGTPIDRYHIDRFFDLNRSAIRGRVIEIQSTGYADRFGSEQVIAKDALDIDPRNRNATIIDDLCVLKKISDSTYDTFIVTQTLQYVYDLKGAIQSIYRVLKPGGALLLSVPCVARIDPNARELDLWRFTSLSVRRLLEESFFAENTHVVSMGNVKSCSAFLIGLASHEISQRALDTPDENFPLVICARAVKSGSQKP